NKQYNQHVGLTYKLPIHKLPFMFWLTSNASYSADYRWDAAPKLPKGSTIEVGNTIQNSNTMKVDARANFASIYDKVPYLKRVNRQFERLANGKPMNDKVEYDTLTYEKGRVNLAAGKRKSIRHKLKTTDVTVTVYDADGNPIPVEVEVSDANRVRIKAEKKYRGARVEVRGIRPRSPFSPSLIGDGFARLAMCVRSVSVSYSETNGTLLPGYLPQTVLFGNSKHDGRLAPGAPFVLGWQDRFFAQKAADRGWITPDTTKIDPYKYTHSATWSYRVSIEPFPYFRLELTGTRTLSRNRTEFYRQLADGQFHALNPRVGGAFSMSTILIPTAFKSSSRDNEYVSEPFQQFADNRLTVAERRAAKRAEGGVYRANRRTDGSGFPDGYGPLAQEVLVPSLLAAYQGRSASRVTLRRFPIFPLPNWQLTYDGLSRISAIKPVVKQLTLRHGYKASYTIGAYMSAEDYLEGPDGYSYVRNKQDDFIPEYIMENISLSESFSPLFGVDLTFVNSLSTRFEIRKTRSLSMSFANNQMVDQDTWEYVAGVGYRFGDLPLLMKTELGGAKVVKSELRLSADFSIRKTQSILRKLEEQTNTPTTGQWGYTFKFAADYMLTSQITVRAFYDRMVNKPLVSLSYPTTTNSFGISLKFTLDK
ncbi:MAG: cell surface protein SprA, partial [Bacteroidetes bacterium]